MITRVLIHYLFIDLSRKRTSEGIGDPAQEGGRNEGRQAGQKPSPALALDLSFAGRKPVASSDADWPVRNAEAIASGKHHGLLPAASRNSLIREIVSRSRN